MLFFLPSRFSPQKERITPTHRHRVVSVLSGSAGARLFGRLHELERRLAQRRQALRRRGQELGRHGGHAGAQALRHAWRRWLGVRGGWWKALG